MIYVHQLTYEQSQSLIGVDFVEDNYFNPIEDADGNYVISIEEVEQTSIEWVKSLPLIEYKPIITPEL
jgi:uncharacterized protein (UPF0262 family)